MIGAIEETAVNVGGVAGAGAEAAVAVAAALAVKTNQRRNSEKTVNLRRPQSPMCPQNLLMMRQRSSVVLSVLASTLTILTTLW